MEQAANRLLFRELVIKLHSFGGRQHVRLDLLSFQEVQGLMRNIEAFFHATGKDNNCGTVVQQFLHVSRLNAGRVLGTGLSPVPFTRSAREELCILVRLDSPLDLEPSPGHILDLR